MSPRNSLGVSRREFVKFGLAAPTLWPLLGSAAAQTAKPNSTFGGVPIGVIVPISFGQEAADADAILRTMVSIGLSHVEMRSDLIETAVGAPAGGGRGGGGGAAGGRAGRGRAGAAGEAPTGNQDGAPPAGRARGAGETGGGAATSEALATWRKNASMDVFTAFRQKFENAGVRVFAFRAGLTETMSDADYDYTFRVARAVGANQITMELPENNGALTKRIGDAAAAHRFYVGYHAHTAGTASSWDEALAQSPYNGVQLDIGHFVAGTNESPIPFMEKHHDRIVSLHVKDRKRGNNGGDQTPMGQGDTPIVELLQLMRKNNYRIPSAIELSYPIPAGSTRVAEVARCLEYCRKALT